MAAVGLLVAGMSARATLDRGPLEESASALAASLPAWAVGLFRAAYVVGGAYVVVAVVIAVLASARQRLVLTLLLALGLTLGGGVIASLVVEGRWPHLLSGTVLGSAADEGFPALRVATLSAVLLVLRPWMVQAFRRLDALLVAVLCVAAWAIGAAGLSDALGAMALGAFAAGTALLVVGSPAGHPDLAAVRDSLGDLGLRVQDLGFVDDQPWGARILRGTEDSGTPLVIKVYGRDAADAHRAARWWHAVVYRDQAMPEATRLQMVEHEALVTLLAERAGVAVTPVVAAAASRGDAMIVLEAPPPSFADADDDTLDDAALQDVWCAVARLHTAGLCHGELTLQHVGPGDGAVVLFDFAAGRVASPPSALAQETATMLTSQAVRVGPARAVEGALAALGTQAVAEAQPYLQRAALPRSLRSSPGLKVAIDGVRDITTRRTGVPAAPPAPIVRVRWRDLLRTTLLVLAAYALLTTVVQLDWDVVLRSWAEATWAWIVIGVLVAQVTSVADATSTMSAVTTRLPLLPLVHLQYAVKLVGLAVSATAGRVALNTAFFRRFGEGPSVAVSATALDSFAGAVVNVGVVVVAVLAGGDLSGALDVDTQGVGRMLAALAVAATTTALVVGLTPALRRWVGSLARSGWSALRVVTTSPSRALVLLGSNLVSLLITAVAMACMVEAIHPSLPFGTVVAVTGGAGLFASIVPVPGNVGVGEAAIAAGLGLAGIPAGPAFAIAVTQRIATSYLPPVFGVYSMRWLRAEDYI